MIYSLDGQSVSLDKPAFIAPDASIVGNVSIQPGASIWFNVVVRGDNDPIVIGEQSNIQDGSVLHSDPGSPLTIGRGVTVGHKAVLHGCTVGDFSLVGINAVVLNGAVIGRHCLIGANALVTENTVIPDGSLVLGSPAKVVKSLAEEQRPSLELQARYYQQNGERFASGLKPQCEETSGGPGIMREPGR